MTDFSPFTPLLYDGLSAQQKTGWLDEASQLLDHTQNTHPDCLRLAAILSGSSHLQLLCKRFKEDIPAIITGKADQILCQARAEFQQSCTASTTDNATMKAVRHYRNHCHFAIALAELWGLMNIETAYQNLSDCAQEGVSQTVRWLQDKNTDKQAGWVIIAMGKLGARELNYSSDIDLIVLHKTDDVLLGDPDKAYAVSQNYNQLTRRLAHILSADTADGFGWRVDYRLRPDPAATPLSLSFQAAISYYESTARSWERAAFIRARPIAGDIELGYQFLESISAFIWRRSFDYTVVEDLQIWMRHLPIPPGYMGFDVKLGAFGIRHVELLVHILQLLGGGRHLELRSNHTAKALEMLADLEWLERQQTDQLKAAYDSWRLIEHRLQYQRDTQTHKLPRDAESMAQFAAFCGFNSADALIQMIAALQEQTKQAARHPIFDRMLETAEDINAKSQTSLTSTADTELSLAWLEDLGYERASDIVDIIDGWASGRIAATRGERARRYLFRLLPKFLTDLSQAAEPDNAFARFADLISGLPAGVQFFALLSEQPQLARLITDILVKAPALTDQISRQTSLFDNLIEPSFFSPLEDREKLASQCPADLPDESPESYLDKLKIWVHEARFRADIHLLHKASTTTEISQFLSAVSDLAICNLCTVAKKDIERRYGQIKDSSLFIIALGRLGCKTLSPRSDIDLLFVYTGAFEQISDGTRVLGLSAYFIRTTQLIISWLSGATNQGHLFDVDTRLRPDGKSGPVAFHISRLESYYSGEAWAWEHIALLKARIIYSSDGSNLSLREMLLKVKGQLPEPDLLAADIQKMRERLKAETRYGLGMKKRKGGFIDLEFFAALKAAHAGIKLDREGLSPQKLLKCLHDTNPNDHSVSAVLQAAEKLEKILQYSQICLPRYAPPPHNDTDATIYRALAEILSYDSVNSLIDAIEKHCQIIDQHLSEQL